LGSWQNSHFKGTSVVQMGALSTPDTLSATKYASDSGQFPTDLRCNEAEVVRNLYRINKLEYNCNVIERLEDVLENIPRKLYTLSHIYILTMKKTNFH
jgi:hypothetical protein